MLRFLWELYIGYLCGEDADEGLGCGLTNSPGNNFLQLLGREGPLRRF